MGGVKLVGKVAGKLVDRQPTSATRWHFDVVVVLMPLFLFYIISSHFGCTASGPLTVQFLTGQP